VQQRLQHAVNTAVKHLRMRKVLEKRGNNEGKLYTKKSAWAAKKTQNVRKRLEILDKEYHIPCVKRKFFCVYPLVILFTFLSRAS
jgi:hypothetical protein